MELSPLNKLAVTQLVKKLSLYETQKYSVPLVMPWTRLVHVDFLSSVWHRDQFFCECFLFPC